MARDTFRATVVDIQSLLKNLKISEEEYLIYLNALLEINFKYITIKPMDVINLIRLQKGKITKEVENLLKSLREEFSLLTLDDRVKMAFLIIKEIFSDIEPLYQNTLLKFIFDNLTYSGNYKLDYVVSLMRELVEENRLVEPQKSLELQKTIEVVTKSYKNK